MRKLVGKYHLGLRNIHIFVSSELEGGTVDLIPNNGPTVVEIGIDYRWDRVIGVLLHELYETALIDLNSRYQRSPWFSNESSDYIFLLSHNDLGEAHERVGELLSSMLPDFSKAYKKYSPYPQGLK